MKKNIFFIIFILTMISCSKLNEKTIKNIEFKNENITTKEKEINISSKEEIKEFNKISKESYKIGAGDVLVFIPSKKDFENLTLQVGPDGNINIPDIGIVKVKDKTIEDVEKEINEKITKIYNFLKYTVIVTQFNNNKVYIWGNVEKTGVIYLSQENNLIETISLAGGIKLSLEDLENSDILCKIIRKNGKTITLNLKDIIFKGEIEKNIKILNGDIVYVSMKKSNENNVYIYGAVNKTGILKYEDGLTLIDAIFRSGGFNRFSDSSKVYILSKSDNKKYSIKEINMKNLNNTSLENIILEPNDIVYVEKNNISTFNDFVNNILEPLRTLNLITDTAINIDTLSN